MTPPIGSASEPGQRAPVFAGQLPRSDPTGAPAALEEALAAQTRLVYHRDTLAEPWRRALVWP